MSDPNRRRSSGLWQVRPWLHLGLAAAAGLLPVLLALPYLGDDLAGAEGAGLSLAARTLGLLPPPGVPLYLAAAHLWGALVPFGSDPWTLHLFSALCLGLTSFWLYLSARRLAFAPAVAFSASLCFALFLPVWGEVQGPSPALFAFSLLALMVYLAAAWLVPLPWGGPSRTVTAFALGALSGLLVGLHGSFWVWCAPLLFLTTIWGWTRRLHPVRVLVSALLGLVLGGLIPALYLPWRAFVPNVFVDTQFLPQLPELLRTLSWGLRASWLGWYLTLGPRFVPASGASLGAVLHALPLLGAVLALLGAGRSLRELLLTPPKVLTSDRERAARLASGAVPFVALLAVLLFWPRAEPYLALSAGLALFFWSLPALEFIYLRFGTPEGHGARSAPLYPTWVGYAALICLPLLFYLQSAPELAARVRRAQAAGSTLGSARAFLKALPQSALVVALDSRWGWPLAWVQRYERERPDVSVVNPADPWPRSGYSGRQGLEVLGGSRAESLRRRWAFGEYWRSGLADEVAAGRPTYLLLRPLPENADRRAFLERFVPEPALASATFGPLDQQQNRLWVHPLRRSAVTVPTDGTRSVPLGGFPPELTLWDLGAPAPVLPEPDYPWVPLTLVWQTARSLEPSTRWVELRVTRAEADPGPEPEPAVWQTVRRVAPEGSGPWASGRRAAVTYALVPPRPLRPGRYRVWAGLRTGEGQRLRAGVDPNGVPAYWLPVGEFTVSSGATTPAQGRSYPAAGSRAVPEK